MIRSFTSLARKVRMKPGTLRRRMAEFGEMPPHRTKVENGRTVCYFTEAQARKVKKLVRVHPLKKRGRKLGTKMRKSKGGRVRVDTRGKKKTS